MAITAHTTDTPVQQPLTQHPVVSEPPLEVALLLAQAVAQLGTADWNAVASRLDGSEEWPAEAGKMTSQGYATAFETIMRQRGLDPSACVQPLARPTRKLVHALYSNLLTSLRSSILRSFDEEAQLKHEIVALRAAHPSPPPPPPMPQEPPPAKEEKRPRTPTTATRKSARKAALADVEEDAVAEAQAGEDVEMATPAAEEDAPREEEADEQEEAEENASPSKKGRRKGAPPSRAMGRRKGRGAAATPVEEEKTPAVEEVEEEDKVKEEEDEEQAPADEGDEGEGVEGEEEEEEEEEETKRPRRGGRKNRTAAAVAAKKANRKRKPSEPPATSPAPSEAPESGRRRKRVKTTEEPTDENDKDAKLTVQRRKAGFMRVIEQLQAERYSHFFESRVTKSIAPLYNVAVRRPTCLRDITKAIKSGAIANSTELMRDVALLCANAMQFNGDEGEDSVGHCAKLMWERFERLMDQSLSVELSME
ncbi:hypothetical protein JCM10449v2_005859 [Rhodotorula kratochvilovae]